jgi:proton-translocating NADH-quinone oxidoreductase chain N
MNINFLDLFENDFLAIFPEIFLLNAIFILLFFGLFYSDQISVMPHFGFGKADPVTKSNSPFGPAAIIEKSVSPLFNSSSETIPLERSCRVETVIIKNIGWLSLWILFLTLFLLYNNPIVQSIIFYNSLILDNFTYFFKFFLILSSFSAILLSLNYFKQEKLNSFEFLILLLFSTLSMLLMISSYDFISFYLTIEFQSLCFYVLAASKRNSEFSTEAGLKYFILGAFSSGLLLFGFSIIYGFTGMTNFGDLSLLFTGLGELPVRESSPLIGSTNSNGGFTVTGNFSLNGILLGMLFVAIGFLFKLTAAPFHMWAPDVYEGSPTAITAFFSITPKIAILAVFTRLFLCSFYDLIFPFQKILLFCSASSMIVGALAALSQHKIKRLLAYSSIGHIGYILLGLSCATAEGVEGFIVYLIVYVVMTINIFAILLSLEEVTVPGAAIDNALHPLLAVPASNRIKYISDLAMLGKSNPILAFTLTCTLFSMAGIPPLAGFCSKFYIFFSALNASLYFFAFLGVVTSVISCFYYIRLIKIMYFEKPSRWIFYKAVSPEIAIILGITLFFILFFFFYPSPIFYIAHKIALSLSF